MTARLERLKTRPEFLKVAASRRKWVTPGLILQTRRRPSGHNNSLATDGHGEQDAIRVGFTVSRKVGNAVRRNRARRRLKAVAEEILADRGRPGHDYVLVGRQATPERPFADLCQDLAQALSRVDHKRPDGAPARTGRRTRTQKEQKHPR